MVVSKKRYQPCGAVRFHIFFECREYPRCMLTANLRFAMLSVSVQECA